MEFMKWLFWVFRDALFMTINALILYLAYKAYAIDGTMTQVTRDAQAGNMVTYAWFELAPVLGVSLHLATLALLCIFASIMLTYYVVFLGFFTTVWTTISRLMTFSWRTREDFTYHTDPVDGNDIFFKWWGVDGVRDRSRILP